uniref:Uncharacterized protein n=1 Tax=Oryzias latipes TaxID=8090 RepID=A0A3B3HAN6_ORYLA
MSLSRAARHTREGALSWCALRRRLWTAVRPAALRERAAGLRRTGSPSRGATLGRCVSWGRRLLKAEMPCSPEKPCATAPPHRATAPPHGATAPPHRATAPPNGATAPPHGATAPPHGATAPPHRATAPPNGATAPPHGATAPPHGATAPPHGATAPPHRATAPLHSRRPDPVRPVEGAHSHCC